jgi:type I restriction enzyme M protein
VATSSKNRNGREAAPKQSFEATLWAAADKLRGNMDAAEYKHVALGLIFLKYISDRFEERRARALADPEEAPLVDERDLYIGDNVFWVPDRARWDFIKENATSVEPTIGQLLDEAMLLLEAENSSLKGVLTKNYARPELYQIRLGEVIALFSNLAFQDEHHGQDVLGRALRIFPRPVCDRRGQARRSVLHGGLGRARAGRDAAAVRGPRLRPVLRLRRHVRAIGAFRRVA